MEQKANQQQQAYNLYLQTEMTQEQIADMLSINRKTLYLWIKQGNWQRVRRSALYTPSILADQYYRQLLALNDKIEARQEQPYPTREETDVIRKLTLTIKQIKNRQTLNESLETMTLFMEHLQRDNMELAQQIGPYSISYINSLASKNPIEKALANLTEQHELEQEFNNTNPDNISSPSEMSGEASGSNGASQTTQPIDPQYPVAPSQEENNQGIDPNTSSPSVPIAIGKPGETAPQNTASISNWPEDIFSYPIPGDPDVIKRGAITLVKFPSPLWFLTQQERMNIIHNPNPNKMENIPNLWRPAPSGHTETYCRPWKDITWPGRRC